MIKAVPKTIFGSGGNIFNIVRFGRLYTDYGFWEMRFNSVVWLHDRTNALAFIVEHEADKCILERFVNKPVYTTHGSGLNIEGFTMQRPPKSKTLRIGYLSRFHNSKGSHEILKAAANLPVDRELIIAGWDIKGDKYSNAFQKIAKCKSNEFLGRLNAEKTSVSFSTALICFYHHRRGRQHSYSRRYGIECHF